VAGSVLALLLNWRLGVVIIGPIVAVMCILAYFLFAKYPLGQPKKEKEA